MILNSIEPGVYRIHPGGVWTSIKDQKGKRLISKYYLFKQLILGHSEDEETKAFYRKKIKRISKKLIGYIPKSSLRNTLIYSKIFVSNHNIIAELKDYKKLLKYNLYFLVKKWD